jgi:hypothetical protein
MAIHNLHLNLIALHKSIGSTDLEGLMARTRSEGGVTQVDMVKKALDELGADAKPLAIQESIKSHFDKVLPTSIISNYKSVLKRKGGSSSSSGTGAPRGRRPCGGSVQLNDLEAVRSLVSRLGADHVKRLVDVLAR